MLPELTIVETENRNLVLEPLTSTSACAGHAELGLEIENDPKEYDYRPGYYAGFLYAPTALSSRSYTSRSTPLRVMHDHRAESSLIQVEVLSAGCRFRRSRSNRRRGRRRRA
jgi:hypothetical protein